MRSQRLFKPVRRNRSYWDRVDPPPKPNRDWREFDTSTYGDFAHDGHTSTQCYPTHHYFRIDSHGYTGYIDISYQHAHADAYGRGQLL